MTALASLEEVDARLRSLPATMILDKDDERAVRRLEVLALPAVGKPPLVVERHTRHKRLRFVAPALTVTAILAIIVNLAAAYYAPSYGRALADAPGIGPVSASVLQLTGLDASDL